VPGGRARRRSGRAIGSGGRWGLRTAERVGGGRGRAAMEAARRAKVGATGMAPAAGGEDEQWAVNGLEGNNLNYLPFDILEPRGGVYISLKVILSFLSHEENWGASGPQARSA
jgi:hypothetical protein